MKTRMIWDRLTKEDRNAYRILDKAGLLEEPEVEENNDVCLQCGYGESIDSNCLNCGAKSGCLD